MLRVVIFGVKINIDFSFLIFLTLVFLIRNGNDIFTFFIVCLIHEAAHAAVICVCGGSIRSLYFYGMGIKLIPYYRGILAVKKEVAVLISGPLANITIYLLLRNCCGFEEFAIINLYAGLFNLLPYNSLDGGALIGIVSENIKCGETISLLLNAFKIIFSLSLLTASVHFPALFPVFCISLFYLLPDMKK